MPSTSRPGWRCKLCSSDVDARMDVCWKCGADSAGTPDPSFIAAVVDVPVPLICATCGYDLRALNGLRCPECGERFEHDVPETAAPTREEEVRWNSLGWNILAVPTLVAVALVIGVVLMTILAVLAIAMTR